MRILLRQRLAQVSRWTNVLCCVLSFLDMSGTDSTRHDSKRLDLSERAPNQDSRNLVCTRPPAPLPAALQHPFSAFVAP